ncbi:hypothetical protein H6A14_04850 [Bifidobacterium pullorum subsp. saeculare]|uniref:hypothetical protein n=1 Tax=Bifidobacterium pullorum TaxID=78448 RepID=UPI00195ECF4A|nr:hypothetical protein [Bifidobacterium pullorum]MBM6730500.1 hypothetical protein [Bifidobacterium pullorum subsp. saeculare]
MITNAVGRSPRLKLVSAAAAVLCCLLLCSCSIKLPWAADETNAVNITMSNFTPVESSDSMLTFTREDGTYHLTLQSEITITNNTSSEILLTDYYYYNGQESEENKTHATLSLAADSADQTFRPSEANAAIAAGTSERFVTRTNMQLSDTVMHTLQDSITWEHPDSPEWQSATLSSATAYSLLENNHLGFFTTNCIYLHSDSDTPTILRRITTAEFASDVRSRASDRYFTFRGAGMQRVTPYCDELYEVRYLLVDDEDEEGMPILTLDQYLKQLDETKEMEK